MKPETSSKASHKSPSQENGLPSSSNAKVSKRKEARFHRADAWRYDDKADFKKAFLKVIEEDGGYFSSEFDSVKKISERVFNHMSESSEKSVTQIQQYFKHFIRIISTHRSKHHEAIDKWAELTNAITPTNTNLEEQLKSAVMVATEEPIPNVPRQDVKAFKKPNTDVELPEPDFSAVYKYLACAVSEMPLPELSPIDSLLVEDCLQSLAEQIKSLDDGDLRLNLRRIFIYLSKTDDKPSGDDEEEIKAQLNNGTIFNPLGLNENVIMPVPPS